MDAWLEWAPLMRAARAEVGNDIAVLTTAIERTGCDAAQARMSELGCAAQGWSSRYTQHGGSYFSPPNERIIASFSSRKSRSSYPYKL
jgi:hypothetical protein